jgi:hypothetical protein
MISVRWPTDYVALDRGRIMVHPDYVGSFFARGWRTLDAVMEADVSVVRRVGERDNCRLAIGGRPAYLKRHWEAHASVRGTPPGRREADAVGWCAAAGVPSMTVIAAGGEGRTTDRRSFFLSEEVAGLPADDFWNLNPDRTTRERAIVALAGAARRFHDAQLFHRDFYWCHFFIAREGGALAARLIDLQRVLRRPWIDFRWRVKDLGQFWFSAPAGVTDDDRAAWFEVYGGGRRRSATRWAALMRAGFYQFKDGKAA